MSKVHTFKDFRKTAVELQIRPYFLSKSHSNPHMYMNLKSMKKLHTSKIVKTPVDYKLDLIFSPKVTRIHGS